MKTLLIGLGQIGLGLIAPTFQKAGYAIVGTDANEDRLSALRHGYILKTPSKVENINIDVESMDKVTENFDLVVTSVGRKHLGKVAVWCQEKGIVAPVLMAENLPDPVSFFPEQIPIVIDRICPRIETQGSLLTVIAEDYYKIVSLQNPITSSLAVVEAVELKDSELSVESRRKQKMFTVNTCHVLAALFGQQFGCSLVEESARHPEVVSRIMAVVSEVGPWLGFDSQGAAARASEILLRFANPIQDSLSRILSTTNRTSALRYIEIPLNGLRSLGIQAPVLEEAYLLLSS
ncbi:MAG: hypothetical protein HYT15_00515 [Candidatus Magasanikbacteria bacterium]|nr:hypothetical protein [Candidatus Magasanikbacteria bacterium]